MVSFFTSTSAAGGGPLVFEECGIWEYVYDHTRPSAAAGGAVGTMAHSVPSPTFHNPHPPSEVTASIVKTNSHEPGKREKRTLVLRDRNLSGMAEGKTHPSMVSNLGSCSDPQPSPEMKPTSYLDAIRSGLDDLEASSSYNNKQQLCPYAAAGECRFGDACVYLHGEVCEICRLRVLHPFDPEQRKAHEKESKGWTSDGLKSFVWSEGDVIVLTVAEAGPSSQQSLSVFLSDLSCGRQYGYSCF
ncbi:putative E3 ubiquitin-protein ligase makorin-2 [Saguinus oedipus]|uniref:RING-type E3 ubiquitin transferase n=1 Tax=Saguinus oedipus TaxID=9490 RepID=A0ABQ9U2Z6_SAGOE|nr:putative E3 ubiquitin-protein ligase makorin-2 [Saguinus oedipus]